MESRNPVFGRSEEFARGGHASFDTRTPSAGELQDMYGAPAATTADTRRMTIDDVVIRTASLFTMLLVTAGVTFTVVKPSIGPVIGAALVGFGLVVFISFSKKIRPPVMFVYAAVEGVFVGGISYFFEGQWPGIVLQAVLGTFATFGAMLALYKFNVIRATPKFRRILMIAIVGYLAFAVLNIVLSAFGVIPNVYDVGGLGLLVSVFGVGLAALFLVLDFDNVEQGINNGLPERFAWTAAFGLIVTLVWLYIEILRLLAILRGDS